MKNITNYINEAKMSPALIKNIENLERAAADTICINYAFIDVFESILKNTKENAIDIMYTVSFSVEKYNDKVPTLFKKYSGGSTTNITVGDWNSMLSYYMFPDVRKDYSKRDKLEKELKNSIVKGVDKPYAGFGTTYSKKSLENMYDILKDKLSDDTLKKIIKELKSEIPDIKRNYKEKINTEKTKFKDYMMNAN